MDLNSMSKKICCCGKEHNAKIDDYVIKKNAVALIPSYIKKYGAKKAFVVFDINTKAAAGNKVIKVLSESGIEYTEYMFNEKALKPDEKSVGSVIMHFDNTCDIVIAVGSGVINDICKILSATAKLPYFTVGTAPSMDGYASETSSMECDGLKVSIPSKCANVIIGDIDILKNANTELLISGLGDMLAKYISICEWRISNLINGEYYCEKIANLIRNALDKCVKNAAGLIRREDEAVSAVFEGLILGGIGMNYAGVSRPASGVEHYFSHTWDMRGLEFGTPVSTHGIQCAIGTMYAAKIYENLKNIKPDKEKALKAVSEFDYKKHSDFLTEFFGKGAKTMIDLEQKEGKYDIKAHINRIDKIIDNWDEILKIISEEIPPVEELTALYDKIGLPKTAEEIGLPHEIVYPTFCVTKDIRDKYVLSRLCFDLGIIKEINL